MWYCGNDSVTFEPYTTDIATTNPTSIIINLPVLGWNLYVFTSINPILLIIFDQFSSIVGVSIPAIGPFCFRPPISTWWFQFFCTGWVLAWCRHRWENLNRRRQCLPSCFSSKSTCTVCVGGSTWVWVQQEDRKM